MTANAANDGGNIVNCRYFEDGLCGTRRRQLQVQMSATGRVAVRRYRSAEMPRVLLLN